MKIEVQFCTACMDVILSSIVLQDAAFVAILCDDGVQEVTPCVVFRTTPIIVCHATACMPLCAHGLMKFLYNLLLLKI